MPAAMATRSSTLIPLALLVLLFAAVPAPAAVVEPLPVGPAVLALDDEEEEPEAEAAAEEVEEVCEEVEEEGFEEECEEVEAEPRRAGRNSAEDCLLRSARGHASVDPRGRKLKLTIGYTTYEPVKDKIDIRRGSDRIASLGRHLGRSGVLRITKKLGAAKSGKRIVVRIELPSARNAGCPSRRLVLFPR